MLKGFFGKLKAQKAYQTQYLKEKYGITDVDAAIPHLAKNDPEKLKQLLTDPVLNGIDPEDYVEY